MGLLPFEREKHVPAQYRISRTHIAKNQTVLRGWINDEQMISNDFEKQVVPPFMIPDQFSRHCWHFTQTMPAIDDDRVKS